MFSSPTPAQGSRALAANALRSAGLIDRDERMQDVSDKAGGRKGTSKIRSHRVRPIDQFKNSAGTSSTRLASNRLLGARISSAAEALRGAGKAGGVIRPRAQGMLSGGGTALRVKKTAKSSSIGTVEVWKEFLSRRYNAEAKFLNLDKMANDDFIIQNKLAPPGHPDASSRVGSVIFKLASQLNPPVETISIADNHITTGEPFRDLSRYLPKLRNLSLAGNKLRDMRDLDPLAAKKGKLVQLRELVLAGNPVREDRVKAGALEKFKSDIARKFTSLELLDSEPLAKISFDVGQASTSTAPAKIPDATSFPCAMAPSFITGVDGSLVSAFCVRFFDLFDNTRSALANAYDPNATFSFSCNTSIPQRGRIQGFNHTLPNQKNLTWGPWLTNGSRNLNRISGESQNVKYLSVGWSAIHAAMAKIPATKHEISGPPENFCLDAFPVALGPESMGLMINVHGQFAELPSEGIRSFDRTFILAMAPPNSTAQQNGWNVIILSDQFIVRNYSSPEWWKPGPLTLFTGAPLPSHASSSASAAVVIPPDQQQFLETVPEPQRTQVRDVVQRTKLNVKFAVDCLVQNGWDTERAIANFQEVKNTLGQDAFL